MSDPLPTRPPLDPFPYGRHPESRPFSPDLEPGQYVFVQDAAGIVFVLMETEGHLHPKVLGGGAPAAAAGGLKLASQGVIVEIDNFSGTFQFGPEILPQVREALTRQGGTVADGAERPFSYD
jgi:hypothetical protein